MSLLEQYQERVIRLEKVVRYQKRQIRSLKNARVPKWPRRGSAPHTTPLVEEGTDDESDCRDEALSSSTSSAEPSSSSSSFDESSLSSWGEVSSSSSWGESEPQSWADECADAPGTPDTTTQSAEAPTDGDNNNNDQTLADYITSGWSVSEEKMKEFAAEAAQRALELELTTAKSTEHAAMVDEILARTRISDAALVGTYPGYVTIPFNDLHDSLELIDRTCKQGLWAFLDRERADVLEDRYPQGYRCISLELHGVSASGHCHKWMDVDNMQTWWDLLSKGRNVRSHPGGGDVKDACWLDTQLATAQKLAANYLDEKWATELRAQRDKVSVLALDSLHALRAAGLEHEENGTLLATLLPVHLKVQLGAMHRLCNLGEKPEWEFMESMAEKWGWEKWGSA